MWLGGLEQASTGRLRPAPKNTDNDRPRTPSRGSGTAGTHPAENEGPRSAYEAYHEAYDMVYLHNDSKGKNKNRVRIL